MKIKSKLTIGMALLLLLMIGITTFGYERLSQMNQSINHFYDNRFEKVRLALAVRGEINSAARLMNDMILGEEVRQASIDEISQRLSSAWGQFDELAKLKLDDVEKAEMNQLTALSESYGASLKQFIELASGNRMEDARQLYTAKLRDEQRQIIDAMDQVVKLQETAMKDEMSDSRELYSRSVRIVAILILSGLLLGIAIIFWIFPSITSGLNLLGKMADRFAKGRLKSFGRFEIGSKDELGELAKLFQRIALDLHGKNERERELSDAQRRQSRVNGEVARVTELLQAGSDAKAAAQLFISEFAPALGANYGLVYVNDPLTSGADLELSGTYAAMADPVAAPAFVRAGEGLIGQCYRDGRSIAIGDLPDDYVKVGSGLGAAAPRALVVQPIYSGHTVIGVIELASVKSFDEENTQLLALLCDKLGTVLNNMLSRRRVEELLRESQAMTEELQVQSEELVCQQEELRETNDKLEAQQNDLKQSEQRLQQQQEELEYANQELTVKTLDLQRHVQRVELQNRQIAQANGELERQAIQLALSSKYKSEFLANMSHELRTPLNSLIILSEFLVENREGNLTGKQQDYMRTIHTSGSDLLKMIDEILDLSKMDAGKMDIHPEWMVMEDIAAFLRGQFGPMADAKRLSLSIEREDSGPEAIWSDGHRIKQIMRNLMSNALKFTEAGEVSVRIRRPREAEMRADGARPGVSYVALSVSDTGIGIPEEKRELVFEAFRQADGTTSRKYGGTGLGLTISRELAHLLEGWIHLEDRPGGGSVFTLVVPERLSSLNEAGRPPLAAATEAAVAGAYAPIVPVKAEDALPVTDDRGSLSPEDRKLLIIEDDVRFAKVLLEMARARGYKAVVAVRGDDGLSLARSVGPDAVILDIQLPGTDGWSILAELKSDGRTRHIPVHVVSVTEFSRHGLRMGAIDHVQKPASGEQLERVFANIEKVLDGHPRRLLLVAHEAGLRASLKRLIAHDDVDVVDVADANRAWEQLEGGVFDCIVLDGGLPADEAESFLSRIRGSDTQHAVPIIVYGGGDDHEESARRLRLLSESIVVKDVRSPERLLEETTLFLHRVESDLPEEKRDLLKKLTRGNSTFEGKTILLVDDDARNVFALSSVLEHRGMRVVFAENGKEALEKLEARPDIDLVLMDVMMPEMDGYEAMRRIREHAEWRKLPVIALTAKAMKDDRNKCIEAGASDYITKPVNTEQLLSLMRVWLHR
ncbi:response regulator [Cohnella sp. GCM10027633]|uniref:response regulator n=1 Tax=unclassified Cohnella TaxID=2636738 RepID=UPI00363E9FC3